MVARHQLAMHTLLGMCTIVSMEQLHGYMTNPTPIQLQHDLFTNLNVAEH